MKDQTGRRVNGPELARQPSQSPEAALGRRPVLINGGLHAMLKAKAAKGGRPLQVLVESRLLDSLEPSEREELETEYPVLLEHRNKEAIAA